MKSTAKVTMRRPGVLVVAVAALAGCAGCGAEHIAAPVASAAVTSPPSPPDPGGSEAPGAGAVPVAPPGTGASGSPAQVAAANRMTADNVAGYCRQTGELAQWGAPEEIGSPANFAHAVEILVPLKPHTPAVLVPDVNLLQADYQAVADQRRVFVQIKDEVDPAYARIMAFRHSLCDLN